MLANTFSHWRRQYNAYMDDIMVGSNGFPTNISQHSQVFLLTATYSDISLFFIQKAVLGALRSLPHNLIYKRPAYTRARHSRASHVHTYVTIIIEAPIQKLTQKDGFIQEFHLLSLSQRYPRKHLARVACWSKGGILNKGPLLGMCSYMSSPTYSVLHPSRAQDRDSWDFRGEHIAKEKIIISKTNANFHLMSSRRGGCGAVFTTMV